MEELIISAARWRSVALVGVLFGLAPGLVIRVIAHAWPKTDGRRAELRAELSGIEYWRRPLWVFEQFETALCDALPLRARSGSDRVRPRLAMRRGRPQLLRTTSLALGVVEDPYDDVRECIRMAWRSGQLDFLSQRSALRSRRLRRYAKAWDSPGSEARLLLRRLAQEPIAGGVPEN